MSAYVGSFVQDIQEMKALILTSGAGKPAIVVTATVAHLTNPLFPAASHGKSEVGASDGEEPSP